MTDALAHWHALLRPEELSGAYFGELSGRMRAARLTFGDRVHCPFLRPFFLTEADERRIREVAETVAAVGERVAAAAVSDPRLQDDVGLTQDERHLVNLDPRYATASTASRLDAFLLPDTVQCAEYNAESPAGLGYSETLAGVFDALPIMGRFRERFDARTFPLMRGMLDALLASYREWGGRANPPLIAIVDWRGVPTWSEFEILRDRFEHEGVPTLVCDPRDLEISGGGLMVQGRRIDLVYRRVLMNDIIARPDECRALLEAYTAGLVCVANTFRCKVPHKKAFFAILTDERHERLFSPHEHAVIRRHVPWTRLLREGRTTRDGATVDLLPFVRQERERLVVKPNDEYGGAGVALGWERTAGEWDAIIATAIAPGAGAWVVQERIAIRREVFPYFEGTKDAAMRDMLVDFAPYLFRGRMAGFLTRLSATGLANVTSGGGQVPVFVVAEKA